MTTSISASYLGCVWAHATICSDGFSAAKEAICSLPLSVVSQDECVATWSIISKCVTLIKLPITLPKRYPKEKGLNKKDK